MLSQVANIAALIVGVAMASVIVMSPNTVGIVQTAGAAFANSITAAKG